MAKKVLYRQGFEKYESEAFFEVSGNELKLITAWSYNDADYRNEYMSGLISYFEGEIKQLPAKLQKKAQKVVEEYWGF